MPCSGQALPHCQAGVGPHLAPFLRHPPAGEGVGNRSVEEPLSHKDVSIKIYSQAESRPLGVLSLADRLWLDEQLVLGPVNHRYC